MSVDVFLINILTITRQSLDLFSIFDVIRNFHSYFQKFFNFFHNKLFFLESLKKLIRCVQLLNSIHIICIQILLFISKTKFFY